MSAPYVAGSAMRQTSLLMLLQIGARLMTFVLNALVVRVIGPTLFGIAQVNFYLVYTTVLFLAREGLRRACLRSAPTAAAANTAASMADARTKLGGIINLTWIVGVPIAAALAAGLGYVALRHPPTLDAAIMPEHDRALLVYIAAALIEMLGEPLYIAASALLLVRVRVGIELCAMLLRTGVTAVLALHFQHTLMAFAIAQFAFSLCTTALYYAYFAHRILRSTSATPFELKSLRDLLPRRLARSADAIAADDSKSASSKALVFLPDAGAIRLVAAFTVQSTEKLLLTEGEKFVIAGFSANLEENGIYSLVQNLGSLVARMIFQPIEEASFSEFSNLLAPFSARTTAAAAAVMPAAATTPASEILPAVRHATAILATLLKSVTLLGLVFVCFGPPFTRVLFECVYGARWSHTSAPVALSWYCFYVLLMAVNGVSESFVLAALPSAVAVHAYNVWLAAFSVVYMGAAWLALPFGARGLIAANCVNFAARIAYGIYFFRAFQARARALGAEAATEQTMAGMSRIDGDDVEAGAAAAPADDARRAEPLFVFGNFVRAATPFWRATVMSALVAASALVWASHWLLGIGTHTLLVDTGDDASTAAADVGLNSFELRRVAAAVRRVTAMCAFGAHVVCGALAFGAFAYVMVRYERAFLDELRQLLTGRRGHNAGVAATATVSAAKADKTQ